MSLKSSNRFQYVKTNWAIIMITIAGFFMRLYMAHLDPFLHEWDERFHALVARNMMRHPLKPMLVANPVLSYDPNIWCCNSIWLHKQPLFMWQMALSMKLFGVSEFSIRNPSVLLGTLMIPITYRITLLLTNKKLTAIIAALLLCFSYYQLELISGRFGMDHNDLAFGFYILASVWAYFEYLRKPRWYWVVLVGIFSGCAILNKWLTGLLVYSAWGFYALRKSYSEKNWRPLVDLIFSVFVCCIVFLPWQFYILSHFPELARYEYAFNTKHIFEVVEGQKGGPFFYIQNFDRYFGLFIWVIAIIGIRIALCKAGIAKKMNSALLIYLSLVFVFFSFVVKTKVPSYFFVVAPFVLIFMAIALEQLYEKLRRNKWLFAVAAAACLFISARPVKILNSLKATPEREARIYNTNIYKNLKQYLRKDVNLVINVNEFEHIDLMFYNEGITANHWFVSEEDLKKLSLTHTPIAAFENHGNYILPEYIRNYHYLHIIPIQLK